MDARESAPKGRQAGSISPSPLPALLGKRTEASPPCVVMTSTPPGTVTVDPKVVTPRCQRGDKQRRWMLIRINAVAISVAL